jgi:UDP-N-acetylglucosamine 2-epimerase (non-hydrolysing)/GDP/UDP-N,N'-diacetylbacillosamine 2-epimerase (hydrolysing)
LGEEPWRVIVSGAPSLDNLYTIELLTPEELEAQYDVRLQPPPLLVTYHPVTLEYEQTELQITELLDALEVVALPTIFTLPNADTNRHIIQNKIADYVHKHATAWMVDNLGTQGYFSLMSYAAAMVGNSSSGIIEAAAFRLPVVNIGTRQEGRLKPANVVDVGYERSEILKGIQRALQPEFRKCLWQKANPYGDGHASDKIVGQLKEVAIDNRLIEKRFHDLAS